VTAVLLGLASALAFGTSDFLAGVLSRRMNFALVGLLAQLSAAGALCLILIRFGGAGPTAATVGWGTAAGLGSGVGSLALYRGLGSGQMHVVAPLSALGGAALPVLVGFALGERPSWLAVLGIGLALPAVWLIARPADTVPGSTPAGAGDGLLAGGGFALFFVALNRAGDQSGMWPVAVGQVVSLLVVVAFVLGRRSDPGRTRWQIPRRTRAAAAPALLVGGLAAAATVLYFLATSAGLLSVVAVLTSLYPAVTVVLAAVVLHERTSHVQRVGLLIAAAAATMIAVT
jgi:drug/metabolite transporter (DMT)-like permease